MTTTAHDNTAIFGAELIPLDVSKVAGDRSAARVRLDEDGAIVISELRVDDPAVVSLVASATEGDRASTVAELLAVGARGMASMGVGLDIGALDTRVRSTLEAVADETERRVGELIEAGRKVFHDEFDPAVRSSLMGRSLTDFAAWRDEVLGRLDLGRPENPTALFLTRLGELIGDGGALEKRLDEALDPDADGSALGRVSATINQQFEELRELVIHGQGVAEGRDVEARRGTAQGTQFEDIVEEHLRTWAAGMSGMIVERTTRDSGDLSKNSKVGDFVVTTPEGWRVVVEAKHQASVSLTGKDGILGELDRAMANRSAVAGVCISGRDAFPQEVGTFAVYGDRVLAVDDGEGTMVTVAMRWAIAQLGAAAAASRSELDLGRIVDRVDRIRKLAESLRNTRRTLTDVTTSIQGVHASIGEMRTGMLELIDDVERELKTP